MSQLFDNEQFIGDKIRALEQQDQSTTLMEIEFMPKNEKHDHVSILLETYDLSTDFIKSLEKQFQTRIGMIFATNRFTTQIFINNSPILRLLD